MKIRRLKKHYSDFHLNEYYKLVLHRWLAIFSPSSDTFDTFHNYSLKAMHFLFAPFEKKIIRTI